MNAQWIQRDGRHGAQRLFVNADTGEVLGDVIPTRNQLFAAELGNRSGIFLTFEQASAAVECWASEPPAEADTLMPQLREFLKSALAQWQATATPPTSRRRPARKKAESADTHEGELPQ